MLFNYFIIAFKIRLNSPTLEKYSGPLSMITNYLETVSCLLVHVMKENKEDPTANIKFLADLNILEQLIIQVFTYYPELSKFQRKTGHISILKIVDSLYKKHHHHYAPFVQRIVSSSLSCIIASPTSAELDIIGEAWKIESERLEQGNDGNHLIPKRRPDSLGLQGVSAYLPIWANIVRGMVSK